MPSRGEALSRLLRAPPDAVEVRSVKPDGDCFYNAIDQQLGDAQRSELLASADAMRDLVADSLTSEIVDMYRMYAMAGVEDFAWLNHHAAPTTVEGVREFARRRGCEQGAGRCLWADEHAMRTVAAVADAVLLIVDEQAPSTGSRSGRRRGDDSQREDSRFVLLGELEPATLASPVGALTSPAHCFIMHRSRRQHFSPVFFRGRGRVELMALPEATRALWPRLRELTCSQAMAATGAANDGERDQTVAHGKRRKSA